MKKRIIITILGLLILMATHVSLNLYFLTDTWKLVVAPLWASIYSSYILLMVKWFIMKKI
jgi:hypothetical protein